MGSESEKMSVVGKDDSYGNKGSAVVIEDPAHSSLVARKGQSLVSHLLNTATLAKEFAKPLGLGEVAYALGILHDLGKGTSAFQQYINGGSDGKAKRRGEVLHSWMGAKAILDRFGELRETEGMADILSNIIASHHGGLTDMIFDAERTMPLRIKGLEGSRGGDYEEARNQKELQTLVESLDWNKIVAEYESVRKSFSAFDFHLVVKFLFSCLVDADRCDAAGFNKRGLDTSRLVCEKWIDVRTFGQVFALNGNGDQTSEDEGADKSVSLGIRGPVTITNAFSRQCIVTNSMKITKSVNSEDKSKKGSDTFGWKHCVEKAVYVAYGSMYPLLAEKTGFSEEDAEKIKLALQSLFEGDASSARPAGSMRIIKVLWCVHNSPCGQFSPATIQRTLEEAIGDDGSVNAQLIADRLPGLKIEFLDELEGDALNALPKRGTITQE